MSISQLKELAELRRSGDISDGEYEARKARIFAELDRPRINLVRSVLLPAAFILLIFAVWAIGMPYWTAYQIQNAIERRDPASLSDHIDFDALRANWKETIRTTETGYDAEDNIFGEAGELLINNLATGFVDGLSDRKIAEGIIEEYLKPSSSSTGPEYNRTGFSTFHILAAGRMAVLELEGLSWKIVDIAKAPSSESTRPNGGKSPSSGQPTKAHADVPMSSPITSTDDPTYGNYCGGKWATFEGDWIFGLTILEDQTYRFDFLDGPSETGPYTFPNREGIVTGEGDYNFTLFCDESSARLVFVQDANEGDAAAFDDAYQMHRYTGTLEAFLAQNNVSITE